MEKRFVYDSYRDWEVPNKQTVYIARASGVLLLFLGGSYFLQRGWELDWWNKFIAIFMIVVGIFQFIDPSKLLKLSGLRNEFVTIDSETISWKLGRSGGINETKISEIEDFSVFIGEIHFKLKTGEILKLKSHRIQNDKKHKEFREVIQHQIKNMVKDQVRL